MKRPTLVDVASKLLEWKQITGLVVYENGLVFTNGVSDEDKCQVRVWLYERYVGLSKKWMDWVETKLEAEEC